MRRLDEVLGVLRRHEPEARALGVQALYLFGSTARDEAGADSDIDLFIDPDYARLGFVELFRLETRLSEALGRPVDLSTRKGLHPLIRPEIERNAIKVFG
jgi:uncharacterized protein